MELIMVLTYGHVLQSKLGNLWLVKLITITYLSSEIYLRYFLSGRDFTFLVSHSFVTKTQANNKTGNPRLISNSWKTLIWMYNQSAPSAAYPWQTSAKLGEISFLLLGRVRELWVKGLKSKVGSLQRIDISLLLTLLFCYFVPIQQ